MRNLCITITFVEGKPRHHVSYKHHQSHRWHQLGCPIRPTLSPAFSLYPLRPYYATWHATYAQAWSSYHQTTQPAQRSLHSQLPQRWLRYWSYPGVQSSQAAGKETKNVVPAWTLPGLLTLSVSANTWGHPSRTPWVKMPLPGGTSWGRPSTLRPCRPSAERRGQVATGSTPAFGSWSPFLRPNDKPSWTSKRTIWENSDNTLRCTQCDSKHCQTLDSL